MTFIKPIFHNIFLAILLFLVYMFIPFQIFINTGNFIELAFGISKSEMATYLPMLSFLTASLYLCSAHYTLSLFRGNKDIQEA